MEALQPAIDGRMPVAFEANRAREILRVLKFAKELKLQPIVTGGREAVDVATDLKSQNVRVVYSLDFPQRPRALAPDADEPIETLKTRADAPKAPGELAKAGVTFAFESAGLTDPKDFVKNAAKAVKAGLTEDAAIRALTITAATMASARLRSRFDQSPSAVAIRSVRMSAATRSTGKARGPSPSCSTRCAQ